MFIIYDTFNDCAISFHRTIKAAVKNKNSQKKIHGQLAILDREWNDVTYSDEAIEEDYDKKINNRKFYAWIGKTTKDEKRMVKTVEVFDEINNTVCLILVDIQTNYVFKMWYDAKSGVYLSAPDIDEDYSMNNIVF